MSLFEFVAPTGYTWTVTLRNPLNDYASVETGITASEVVGTLYRATATVTGVVYMVAVSGVARLTGYINLAVTNPNGYSEVFNTYEDALQAGLLSDISATLANPVTPTVQTLRRTGSFTIKNGVDCTQTFNITVPANWSKIYFTAKSDHRVDTDAQSIIQVLVTNPSSGGDGLIYLNGAAHATQTDGSLTVNGGLTQITLFLKAAVTSLLAPQTSCRYDFRIIRSDSRVPYIAEPELVKIEKLVANATT